MSVRATAGGGLPPAGGRAGQSSPPSREAQHRSAAGVDAAGWGTQMRGSGPLEHPLAMGSFSSWMRLTRGGRAIDRAFLPRWIAVSLSTLATSPLRLYESVRWGRAVRRTEIHSAPVFIVGHWRTGTTHLHNLLCTDPQFGWVSTFQAMTPGFCRIGGKLVKPALARAIAKSHPTREIDNIPLSLDAPQEEAFALGNLTPYASLHVYSLPRRAAEIFTRYALLEGLSATERAEWIRTYTTLLRKTTLLCGGKRLVLKDPASTGRIRTLLELFPEARFIHIVRDPYRVYRSTLGVHRIVMGKARVQEIQPRELEDLVTSFYAQLMRKYLAERTLVPPGHLVEVRYEELESRPMQEMRRVYETLGLPGFAEAEPRLRAYLDSISGFQKNEYRVDDAVIERVNRHWGFALEEWGHPRLEPRGAGAAAPTAQAAAPAAPAAPTTTCGAPLAAQAPASPALPTEPASQAPADPASAPQPAPPAEARAALRGAPR